MTGAKPSCDNHHHPSNRSPVSWRDKEIMTITSAISWYRFEDYQSILDVIEDAGLPGAYDEWLKDAENEERESQGKGRVVVRVMIDPKELTTWCRQEGRKLDADALYEFTLWLLYQQAVAKE